MAICTPENVETLAHLGRLAAGTDLSVPDARAKAVALLPPRILTDVFTEEKDVALNKLTDELRTQATVLAPLGYQWSFVGEFLGFPNNLVGEAIAGATLLGNGQLKIFSGIVTKASAAIEMKTALGPLQLPLNNIGGLHVLVPILPKNKMGSPDLDALPAGRYKRFSNQATHPDVIRFLTEVNDPLSGWQPKVLKPGVAIYIGQPIAFIYVDPSNTANGHLISGYVKRFTDKPIEEAIIETRFGEWPLHFIAGQKIYVQRNDQ